MIQMARAVYQNEMCNCFLARCAIVFWMCKCFLACRASVFECNILFVPVVCLHSTKCNIWRGHGDAQS